VLASPDNSEQFGARIRELTGGTGVAAVYDGIGATTFDASLAQPGQLGCARDAGVWCGRAGPIARRSTRSD
jgi:NADPH2:quinone reductase